MTTTPPTRVHIELDERSVDFTEAPRPEATLARAFAMDRVLGEGGMGQVLAARDKRLGRHVAVKVLHDELKNNPQLRGRFLTEAQVGGQLEHPNIVPVYAFELTTDGSPAFVMQLVAGETLDDYIMHGRRAAAEDLRPRGRYGLKERLSKLLPVCDAIAYAHARGVIHRDLKPANVMLGAHNEVLVMDWGIARVEDAPATEAEAGVTNRRLGVDDIVLADGHETLNVHGPTVAHERATPHRVRTQSGAVLGTPQYMAPEQAAGGTITPAADQFALGLMVFELATLAPARPDNTRAAYAQALVAAFGDDDRELRRLDARLAAIIRRATHIVPESRYASVAELGRDLAAYVRDEEVAASPDGAARKVLRAMQQHPALSVGAIMSVLLAAAAVAIVSLRSAAEHERMAAEDTRALARVTSHVARSSRAIENALRDVEASVVALGSAVQVRLDAEPDLPDATVPAPADFESGQVADLVTDPLDGEPRSFSQPVFVLAPDAPDSARAEARSLSQLDETFQRLLLRSSSGGVSSETGAAAASSSGLVRLGIALDDGLYAQLPGRAGFPADFDARRTDWYRTGLASGAHFAPPKYGPLGRTVRVSFTAPYESAGHVAGVIVGEVALDRIVALLALPNEPATRRVFLASADAHEVASRELLDAALDHDGVPEAPLALPALASASLARALASGEGGGFVVDGDTLYVFDRTSIADWTFVAALDRAAVLSGEP